MRLNEVLPRYADPVICTYDANLLNATLHSISCARIPWRSAEHRHERRESLANARIAFRRESAAVSLGCVPRLSDPGFSVQDNEISGLASVDVHQGRMLPTPS